MKTIVNYSYEEFLKKLDEKGLLSFRGFGNPQIEYQTAKAKHIRWIQSRYEALAVSLNNQPLSPDKFDGFCSLVAGDLRFIY